MFSFILKLFQLGLSLNFLALGAHGMAVYISRASIPHGIENVKFLLLIDVPSQIQWFAQPLLQWMTNMSLENFYAPAIALFLGVMIKLSMERGHGREGSSGTEGNFISYRKDNSLMPDRRLREEDDYED